MTTKRRKNGRRGRCGKILFFSKLDAEIVLARLVWKDTGQKRVQHCNLCYGDVWHITSQDPDPGRNEKRTGSIAPQSIDAESSRAIA